MGRTHGSDCCGRSPWARWRLWGDASGTGQSTCSGCTLGCGTDGLTCFRKSHFVFSPSVPGRSGFLRCAQTHFPPLSAWPLHSLLGEWAGCPRAMRIGVQASEHPPTPPRVFLLAILPSLRQGGGESGEALLSASPVFLGPGNRKLETADSRPSYIPDPRDR